ncbi:MAG: sarcosine oxidase subunit gamma [Pseudomonadota bacterium]
MDSVQTIDRTHPLSGRVFAGTGVAITLAPQTFRMNLRCRPSEVDAVSKSLGINLPDKINASNIQGSLTALCLGPDEWLLLNSKANPADALAKLDIFHSAVDITHRNTAILVSGPMAAELLNSGCPRDLSERAFPVGSCARTVFGKAEIVLYHVKPNVFRIEVWRSFSDYVFTYLEEAAGALA